MYLLTILLSFWQVVNCQKVSNVGTVGGKGPNGGIGDKHRPVKDAAAYITDATIPASEGSVRQLHRGKAPIKLSSYPEGPNQRFHNITIDVNKGARQEMLGFGHSWTDSAVEVLGSLEPKVFDQVMKDLFGQQGNNMGLMRHTIGSSDLSYDQYSYDDNGPSYNDGKPDHDLRHFDIGKHGRAMADMIAKMGSYKSDVTQFGSPWSAPSWMKHSGLFIAPERNVPGGGAYYYTNHTFDIQYIPQYAEYFAKYIDAFKARGAIINAITPMNEPLNNQGGYPTMYLDAVDEASLISQALGPLMKRRNVGIWAYDHNTDFPMYPQRVVEGARGHVQAAAWHCYAKPANYSVLNDFHYGNPDMLQFMTECSNYKPKVGTKNFKVASSFMLPVQYWASGASMWVMATDENYGPHSPFGGCDGCSGSIIVHSSTNYTRTNDYYMIGQFSRFIRRGAINYAVTEGITGSELTPTQFYVIATKNPDGSWAIVFMNNMGSDEDVVIKFGDGQPVWQGVIADGTVTTWVLPA